MEGFFRAYKHLYPTVELQFDAIGGIFRVLQRKRGLTVMKDACGSIRMLNLKQAF